MQHVAVTMPPYFRRRAAAVAEDQRLRDSYLGLAIEYERLGEVLERIGTSTNPASAAAENGSTTR